MEIILFSAQDFTAVIVIILKEIKENVLIYIKIRNLS